MVKYNRLTLKNGLRVLVHEDHTTPMAVVNVVYDVGAKDEDPDKTGFAHLFEHLMFGGSVNIPQYDGPLQLVGGENNAFTSNDITNYYITLPALNIETAFWLESDRMLSLAFSEKSLDVQKNVVSEEFKQRYLNQPYGDAWLKLSPLAYKKHPYQWPTIGKELSHIENAKIEDVKAFFKKHYTPQNAILVIAGNVQVDEVKALAEKWFEPIDSGNHYKRQLPVEPKQSKARRKTIKSNVPSDSIMIAFHMGGRLDDEYYTCDLISDILSQGPSSRLYRRLLKEQELFSEINAYITGSIDPGLFIIEGKPHEGVSIEEAEEALWSELQKLKYEYVLDYELEKVKNKTESTQEFSGVEIFKKAMNLTHLELLRNDTLAKTEADRNFAVTLQDIKRQNKMFFKKRNLSTVK